MRNILGILSVFLLIASGCTVHQYKIVNQKLHIYLKDKKAEKVYLLTSLDGFEPHEVRVADSGTWEAILPSDIEFRYFYLIDGKVFLPDCVMKEKDDFGSDNCIYIPRLGRP